MACQNTNCKFTEALLMSPIDANSQPGNINFKIYRQTTVHRDVCCEEGTIKMTKKDIKYLFWKHYKSKTIN